jgi:hypothetical protein
MPVDASARINIRRWRWRRATPGRTILVAFETFVAPGFGRAPKHAIARVYADGSR